MTDDPSALVRFWLAEYAPDVIAVEARRYPPSATIAELLGEPCVVRELPIPLKCTDGFGEAYFGRPQQLLGPGARLANSARSFIEPIDAAKALDRLQADLASGLLDARHDHLRSQPAFHGPRRLIVRSSSG